MNAPHNILTRALARMRTPARTDAAVDKTAAQTRPQARLTGQLGRWRKPGERQRQSERLRGRTMDAAWRARMSASAKLRWAKRRLAKLEAKFYRRQQQDPRHFQLDSLSLACKEAREAVFAARMARAEARKHDA